MVYRIALVTGMMFLTVLGGCYSSVTKPDKTVKLGEYGKCILKEVYSGANPGSYTLTCVSKFVSKAPFVQIRCLRNERGRITLSTGTKWGPHKKAFPVEPKYTKEAPVEYQFDNGQRHSNNWKRYVRFLAYSDKKYDYDNFLVGVKTAKKLSYSVDGDSFILDLSKAPEGMVQLEKLCDTL